MKTIAIITIIFLAMIGLAIQKVTNQAEQFRSTDVTVLRDLTDSDQSIPEKSEITSMFNLNDSMWSGATLRFIDLTDVSHNHTFTAQIKPENQWMGNEFDRKKQVEKFYSSIDTIFQTAMSEQPGKNYSSIYLPLATELNLLSKSPATTKVLLAYSDLMENTQRFSLYDPTNMELLSSKPDSVLHILEREATIGNLSGIKVYLIFDPKNNTADEEYLKVAGFYKRLLESKGAIVRVSANISS